MCEEKGSLFGRLSCMGILVLSYSSFALFGIFYFSLEINECLCSIFFFLNCCQLLLYIYSTKSFVFTSNACCVIASASLTDRLMF